MLHADDVAASVLALCSAENVSHGGLRGKKQAVNYSANRCVNDQINERWLDKLHPEGRMDGYKDR